MEKRVAIVGAGISGLAACKHIASKGLKPMVFEAQEQIGGLWNQTLESTRLQVSRQLFQFSDFPWPSSADVHPNSTQLVNYLQSYAQKFDLLQYIKFNCKVMNIEYVGEYEEEIQSWEMWGGSGKAFGSKGKWIIRVLHTNEDSIKDYETEFVVLCIGRFSGFPNIPECNPEEFRGKVLHSMDYSAMDNSLAAQFIKGKRIAIIGSGKSATDIAFECANANGNEKPCTMIQRSSSITWALPNLNPWGISFGFLCFTRFSELMIHKPGEGFVSAVLAWLLTPLAWLLSKFIEMYVKMKLPLKKHGMIPKESFAPSCRIFILPDENFYDRVEDGSIVLKKSQHFSFCKEGLILDGEDDVLKVDVVIFATGFKGDEKLKNIFSSPTFQNYIVGTPTSTVPLYREMIHPRIPGVAVIGYSESFSNLYTAEMKSIWLAHFLDGAFQLPSIKAMEEDVKIWEKYMKRYGGKAHFRRSCIGNVHIWYNDQLCKDIGCNPRRKKGFFSELFEPYHAIDYKEVAPANYN